MVMQVEGKNNILSVFLNIWNFLRALMVATNGEEEKNKWLEDLTTAINQAKTRPDDAFHYLSLKSISKLIDVSYLGHGYIMSC